MNAETRCTCRRLYVGMHATESREWDYDCPEHGRKSTWWNSAEQVGRRMEQNARLRDLQRQAREARAARPGGPVSIENRAGTVRWLDSDCWPTWLLVASASASALFLAAGVEPAFHSGWFGRLLVVGAFWRQARELNRRSLATGAVA